MGRKRIFTVEYKKEIIKLITEQGKKVSQVAEDIGVSQTSIRRWITEYSTYGENAFPGKGKLKPQDEEVRKIKRRLADLEEENAILKTAVCIFTNPAK